MRLRSWESLEEDTGDTAVPDVAAEVVPVAEAAVAAVAAAVELSWVPESWW